MKTIKTIQALKSALNDNFNLLLTKTKNCSVCEAIKERLKNISKNYPTIPFYELYLEDFPNFQGQNLIFTVPTVLIFKKGQEILRESRFINLKKITNLLDQIPKI